MVGSQYEQQGLPGERAWVLPAVTLAGAMVTEKAKGDLHYNSIAVDQCLQKPEAHLEMTIHHFPDE